MPLIPPHLVNCPKSIVSSEQSVAYFSGFEMTDLKLPGICSPDNQWETILSSIENDFPFAEISEIAEIESWRKEVYRPIYHLHKWWAQRLGSVFRSIILGSSLPNKTSVLHHFYSETDLGGLVVFDPFMGSGTTIGEAIKLGCTVIGRDINPVAYNGVRAAFSNVNTEDVESTFNILEENVGKKIRSLYQLSDGGEVLYYFWVKYVNCPDCKAPVDLFNNYIFSKHAYSSRFPQSKCLCPKCGEVFSARFDSNSEQCPACSFAFDPQIGPAEKAKAKCSNCHCQFAIAPIVKKSGKPPEHRMYAKMVLTPENEKEYRKITSEDLLKFSQVNDLLRHEPPLINKTELKPGKNTTQAMNYCYTQWEQFFNSRQLLALSWLGKEIQKIENQNLRLIFSILFSGTLEFNNMFCSFKGEGTGAVRHMFSHHILKPERHPIEANVWGTSKSSGAFSSLFKSRLLRCLEYRENPFEIEVGENKKVGTKNFKCNKPIGRDLNFVNRSDELRPYSIYLSCGDSSKTDLHDQSVDLVVTDPPFFDNVHYSELADFFYAWQHPLLGDMAAASNTTRHPSEVQDADSQKFSEKLAAVFSECHRVLKDTGMLVFTYHHSKEEGWSAVSHAVASAGFNFVSAQPVKSEMSVAVPKQQAKDPIDLDIILVCRKASQDSRSRLSQQQAVMAASERTDSQIERFWESDRKLSRNDLRIIILSNLLVELSSGRMSKELQLEFDRAAFLINDKIDNYLEKQALFFQKSKA